MQEEVGGNWHREVLLPGSLGKTEDMGQVRVPPGKVCFTYPLREVFHNFVIKNAIFSATFLQSEFSVWFKNM